MPIRPRRNRRSAAIRSLIRETDLGPDRLIYPLFVMEGRDAAEPIDSMPGQARLSIDRLVAESRAAHALGVPAVALFPAVDDELKDRTASGALDPDGLVQRAVRELKSALPDLLVITDVAMDPYSSDGHDGLVEDGEIVNDLTLEILAATAVSQADAGADVIAPSDMMDGRVRAIRTALDAAGHDQVGTLSYTSKYASHFYGPFRDALDSAPRAGDKKGRTPMDSCSAHSVTTMASVSRRGPILVRHLKAVPTPSVWIPWKEIDSASAIHSV